ncbi:MAG: hypothetical protein Tsb005_11590 [Gammaproteobacteria bacterium]
MRKYLWALFITLSLVVLVITFGTEAESQSSVKVTPQVEATLRQQAPQLQSSYMQQRRFYRTVPYNNCFIPDESSFYDSPVMIVPNAHDAIPNHYPNSANRCRIDHN